MIDSDTNRPIHIGIGHGRVKIGLLKPL